MYLPKDIIEIIINFNDISVRDIINLSSTCKYYHQLIENNNTVWRQRFNHRWPVLREVCEKEMDGEYLDFKELVKARIKYKKEVQHFLKQMSKKYYIDYHHGLQELVSSNRFSGFHSWFHCINITVDEEELNLLLHSNETTHHLNYYLLVDEVTNVLPEYSQNGRNNNLTNIYYAKELLSYLKHRHLKHVWQEFINRPAEQQLLEEVATLAAQWFQPDKNISYLHIESHLDKIAQQVMEHLKSVNPNHPIFLALREQFLFWKCHNIDENHWDNSDGRQILDSLCKILFFELNFRAVGYGEIGRRRTAHAFIHSVLEMKVGKALPLAIIFQSVARRLGIRCDLLSFPVILANSWGYSYWLLRWKPKWNLNPNDEECFYINVLHRGIILDNNWSRICEVAKCTIRSDSYCRVNTFELLLEISYYYAVSVDCFLEATIVRSFKGVAYVTDKICWFSRLLDLIKREKGYLTTFEFYIRDKDTILKFIQRVQKVQSNALNEKGWTKLARDTVTGMVSVVCKKDKCRLKRKKRKAGMKFAVGMIVRILSSNKIGVIIRWEKLELSLRTKKSSLYYTVLCDCKKTHCVPEENLRRVVKSIRIPINTDITGIYFSTFKGTYYMPNKILASEYPDDVLYLTYKKQLTFK